jgi:hypothetical protein
MPQETSEKEGCVIRTLFSIKIAFFTFLLSGIPLVFSPSPVFPIDITVKPHGFVEVAAGPRLGDDRPEKEGYNLLEGRFQLKFTAYPSQPHFFTDWNAVFFFKGELLLDGHEEEPDGSIRECYLNISPLSFLDIKAGRQILTWGTGDLIFINDLFPKDFVSFFIGREDQYLKVPSDAIKLSFFSKLVNLDLVFIPFFQPDTPIRGRRLSFYNPFTLSRDGEDSDLYFNKPGHSLSNTEIAVRLNRFIKSYELSVYGFRGYYKQAAGVRNIFKRELFYPELSVFGGSIRGQALGGIGSFEFGYYRSREDTSGHDPFIENSSVRYLFGYERQFKNDLFLSFQYYLNQLLDYHDYRIAQPGKVPKRDEFYQLLTMRVTKLLYHQDVELSLFVFYSPSDSDFHIRPRITYDVTDSWKVTCGGSIFGGEDDYTVFGQLKRNDTIYFRVRYSF